jgi:ribonuclease Z
MKVVLLGTGGYFPTAQRQTACIILPEVGIVLDAGTGMCRIGDYLKADRLDIFLTHAHLDHVTGLTYLINVLPPQVLPQTTVHGESEKLAAVREHIFADAVFPVPPSFIFKPLRGQVQLPQGGTLKYFKLIHPGGAVGFRLDWPGHSLAYVTDTTAAPDAAYLDEVRKVDLLLHESYFADNSENLPTVTGHSALPAVLDLAAEAKPGRLVLLHIDPLQKEVLDITSAKRTFPNTCLGNDFDEFDF